MRGRKPLALLAVILLGTGLLASPALAKKKCKKLCRDDIAACRLAECKPLPNHRRKCNLACKRDTIRLCKERLESPTCSPSGAFVDASAF